MTLPDRGPIGPFTSETFNRADAARNAALRDDVNDHISALGDAFEVVRREAREEALREAWHVARDGCLVPPDGGSPTEDEVALCNNIADRIEGLLDTPAPDSFQSGVHRWLLACFGPEIAADKIERNHRFLEESLELVQACGCTRSEAHQLVDYVFARPVGEIGQEIGGVMNTLAALCCAHDRDMMADGETEMRRVWTMVEKIRTKQAAKPKHSPLPEIAPPDPTLALARLFQNLMHNWSDTSEQAMIGAALLDADEGEPTELGRAALAIAEGGG